MDLECSAICGSSAVQYQDQTESIPALKNVGKRPPQTISSRLKGSKLLSS